MMQQRHWTQVGGFDTCTHLQGHAVMCASAALPCLASGSNAVCTTCVLSNTCVFSVLKPQFLQAVLRDWYGAQLFVLPCTALSPAAESSASKAQQELVRLQQQVSEATTQLEAAKEAASERKAAEREAAGQVEDAKSQLQVRRQAGGQQHNTGVSSWW